MLWLPGVICQAVAVGTDSTDCVDADVEKRNITMELYKDMISFCYVDGQMIARNEGKLKIAVKEEKVEEEEEERSSVLVGMGGSR